MVSGRLVGVNVALVTKLHDDEDPALVYVRC